MTTTWTRREVLKTIAATAATPPLHHVLTNGLIEPMERMLDQCSTALLSSIP